MAMYSVAPRTSSVARNALVRMDQGMGAMEGKVAVMNVQQQQVQDTLAAYMGSLQQKALKKHASPRILVAFGHGRKNSTAIFWQDGYWAPPGSIPDVLRANLDTKVIDLSTLAIVSLGPGHSWFVRWGPHALWNFDGLDKRDKAMLEDTLRRIASDPVRHGGIEGIIGFSFGQAGEVVMVHGFGREATWSDYPSPTGDFTYQINHALLSGHKLAQVSIGVGGCTVIQLQDLVGCSAWSRHCRDWPPPDLRNHFSRRGWGTPLRRIYCSVADHRFWFVSFVDEEGNNVVDGVLEDEAEAEFDRVFSLLVGSIYD